MSYIEGVDRNQAVLFPEALDDYVAPESAARFLDAFVETLDLVALGFERATPAATGRPGYNPRDLLRLYLYGYLHRVRSSRMLEQECARNVEVMWLLRKLRPDHKTIADFRKDHPQALKGVCREFILLCKQMGLLGAELVAVDGSKFRAVNGKKNNYTHSELEKLARRAEEKIAAYLAELDRADAAEGEGEGERPTVEELKEKIERLRQWRERKSKYEGLLARMEPGQRQVSLTDPESRRMKGGGAQAVCYNAQIAVDATSHLIVAEEVTNEENDQHQLAGMSKAAQEVLGVESLAVVADAGYHQEEELARCEAGQIETYVPKPATKSKGREVFPKAAFTYEAEQDAYRCPAGALLTYRHEGQNEGQRLRYYRTAECDGCPLRAQCTSDPQGRRIARTPQEAVVERVAARVRKRPEQLRKRLSVAEHPFGSMKRWMGQGFFLLRGLRKVRGEFSLTVLSYNLRRGINLVGVPRLLEALRQRQAMLAGT